MSRCLRILLAFAVLTLLIPCVSAREPKVDEIASAGEAPPGKIVLLTSGKGMKYFLRVPRGYDEREGARLIMFMHGSNMNGLQYLETMEAERWCRDDIVVCPNGETGDDPFGANNFTFNSAPFIAEVAEDVQSAFKITRSYLGGHSQGGFVTYSAIMNYPELFDGAFPMASDCWMQNEPNLWETKPEMLAKQKDIAIVVIHGQADPVVNFSQGEHAYGVFLAMGYPKLRLFAPEKLGHQFGLSPVPEALEWLDAMTGLDGEASMKLARDWFGDEEWGWVYQAALAVDPKDARNAGTARNAMNAVEQKAAEVVGAMKEALAAKPAREWLPEWFGFRRQFGATEAAKDLVAEYEAARQQERDKAGELFRAAVAFRREKKEDAMKETLEQLLEECPHTYHAWYALEWLGDE